MGKRGETALPSLPPWRWQRLMTWNPAAGRAWCRPPRLASTLHLSNEIEQRGRIHRGFHRVAGRGGNSRKGMIVLPDDIPLLVRPGRRPQLGVWDQAVDVFRG